MKLLVIVLCLLSERYLIHAVALRRFSWYENYSHFILKYILKPDNQLSQWLVLLLIILPVFLISALIVLAFSSLLFGFMGLILNVAILYYCLGPKNPFYPENNENEELQADAGRYFSEVNGQLFAVLFWYIFTGPLGAIIYRMVTLAQTTVFVKEQATRLTSYLDWIPVRMTSMLYMFAGNFQRGLHYFIKWAAKSPVYNDKMLRDCGLASATSQDKEDLSIVAAETLVEHSVLLLLVFLAIFTLGSWL